MKTMAKKYFKNIMELIIKYYADKGYTVINLEQDDNYFTYKLKELNKNWLFGTYIYEKKDKILNEIDVDKCEHCLGKYNSKNYIQARIFTQHQKDIDKFKFTRSYYRAELSFDDVEDFKKNKPYSFGDMEDILELIKKHPWVARYYSGHYISEYFYITPFKAFRKCMAIDIKNNLNNFKDYLNHLHMLLALKWYKLTGKIIKYKIKDSNKELDGLVCYPRYTVYAVAKLKYADDIDKKLENIAYVKQRSLNYGHNVITLDEEQLKEERWAWMKK